jgi:hypothetical protein
LADLGLDRPDDRAACDDVAGTRYGQVAHNDIEFTLLQQAWQQRRPDLDIQTGVFQYYGADPPLSWHLTEDQKQDIRRY